VARQRKRHLRTADAIATIAFRVSSISNWKAETGSWYAYEAGSLPTVTNAAMRKLLKKVTPVIPFAERLEIVRNVRFVDMALAAMTHDKSEIWRKLRFNVLFKGNNWQGTEKGNHLEREFAALGVDVAYFYAGDSSSAPRRTLRNIDIMANRAFAAALALELAHAA
jgi:glycerol-3-phosphate cytidylyltransferase